MAATRRRLPLRFGARLFFFMPKGFPKKHFPPAREKPQVWRHLACKGIGDFP